jgi:hypothetical protein
MTRDGTVGRSDATERSLPFHWDIDPARMMRPRFADTIRASSPAGLREQAGHMTASDFCAARYISSCQVISCSHPGPSGARSPKVGSQGVMNLGNGARFAPGRAQTGARLTRRFNATAHMWN